MLQVGLLLHVCVVLVHVFCAWFRAVPSKWRFATGHQLLRNSLLDKLW